MITDRDVAVKLSALGAELRRSHPGSAGWLYTISGWLFEGGDRKAQERFMALANPAEEMRRIDVEVARARAEAGVDP